MSRSLNPLLPLTLSLITAIGMVSSCVSNKITHPATANANSTRLGAATGSTTASVKKEGIKKFSDQIPDKTRLIKGLFNVYKVEGKYYYEIPDSLLGREMLVITRLAK